MKEGQEGKKRKREDERHLQFLVEQLFEGVEKRGRGGEVLYFWLIRREGGKEEREEGGRAVKIYRFWFASLSLG